jgi:trehalose 2-sulfotransferase
VQHKTRHAPSMGTSAGSVQNPQATSRESPDLPLGMHRSPPPPGAAAHGYSRVSVSFWTPDLPGSDYEDEVRSIFDPVASGDRTKADVDRTLFICFTNRCGSSFVARALSSTGSTNLPREYLRPRTIRNQSARLGAATFDGYLRLLVDDVGRQQVFSLKSGIAQLVFLAEAGFLGAILPAPEFLLVERENVVMQAVSWVLAKQTGQWTSRHPDKGAEPEYDRNAIRSRITQIRNENAAFREFFDRNDLPNRVVTYEEVEADPEGMVEQLAASFGFDCWEYQPDRVRIDVQRTTLNAEWHDRYRRETSGDE